MSARDNRNDRLVPLQISLMILAGLVVLGLGIYLAINRQQYEVLALGVVACMLPAAISILASRSSNSDLTARIAAQEQILASINDRLLISDRAKRIAYRARDRDALRQAILEDIRLGEYDIALKLVEELATTYGYPEEAEQMREQIRASQATNRGRIVSASVARIDELCNRYDWNTATAEAERLIRTYPEYHEFGDLARRISASREQHKHELEREFLTAAGKGEVDRAMELMKELDRHLTPAEAAAYLETARGVISKQRENLGVRFKMAVSDRDWTLAVTVGEQIIREFPNTKFAYEVRQTLDTLRNRATNQQTVEAR